MTNINEPPTSNTGAERTNKSELSACVDWVQVTFHHPPISAIINEVLKLPITHFKDEPGGAYGYNRKIRYSKLKIYYSDTRNDMGKHFELTGSACREFEHHLQNLNMTWQDFFKLCLEYGGKFTRIDIAIDDYVTYLSIPALIKKIDSGECVSKFKLAKIIQGKNIANGGNRGSTLYIGSEKSNLFCRFYEKNYEQSYKRNIPVEDIGPWNRYELQVRNKKAVVLVDVLTKETNIAYVIRQILNESVRFVSKPASNDSNRKRWPVYRPWAIFIGKASKIKLTMKPEIKSIQDNINWLIKQVSTTLETVLTAEKVAENLGLTNDTDYLSLVLENANLKEEHEQRITNYILDLEQKKSDTFEQVSEK
ncbi:replication initiation factor domain-containing protein [Macrococcus capreoli]|uniref:replication initiation factor domain-containing protein n=1 Tax=Macrococcus capreoli TaxID=2982690 RepID=UPI0021D5E8C3|nr:replication initiation factor domain-containing protein [Macrococcus sp. TMW 2.2395]MCU7557634.1 replication initiation factor domain-containing protein [Macrococcus sp. TMW 2.2395]